MIFTLGKIYVLFSIVYAITKAINTKNVEPLGVLAEFVKYLLLFPLCFINDIVKIITKATETEEVKKERRR